MKNKNIFNLILFISIFALGSAYFIEYILGYQACNLCLIERIPYLIAIIIILISFSLNKLEKISLIFLSFIFFLATILSFYHFGIEQGFFSESLVCKVEDLSKLLSKEQLLEQLKQNSVSCKDVSFKVLGLSLAAINTIFSLFLSVIFTKLFLSYEKN